MNEMGIIIMSYCMHTTEAYLISSTLSVMKTFCHEIFMKKKKITRITRNTSFWYQWTSI